MNEGKPEAIAEKMSNDFCASLKSTPFSITIAFIPLTGPCGSAA